MKLEKFFEIDYIIVFMVILLAISASVIFQLTRPGWLYSIINNGSLQKVLSSSSLCLFQIISPYRATCFFVSSENSIGNFVFSLK